MEVLCDEAEPGQKLALSGDTPALGGWDPAKSIKLQPGAREGTWFGRVPNPGANARFKFLLLPANKGQAATWETLAVARAWPAEAARPGARIRAKFGRKKMKVDEVPQDGLFQWLFGTCCQPVKAETEELDFTTSENTAEWLEDLAESVKSGRILKKRRGKKGPGCCACICWLPCMHGFRLWVKRQACSENELKMLHAANAVWEVVNVDGSAMLDRSETMLILKVLDEEHKWALPGGDYRSTIGKFVAGIKQAADTGSVGGEGVTEDEFKNALLRAISDYSQRVISAIIRDVTKEYDKLKNRLY